MKIILLENTFKYKTYYYTIIIYFKSYKLCLKLGYHRKKKFIFNVLQTLKNDYMSNIYIIGLVTFYKINYI
jgi:hypothetical protein